MPLIHVYLAKGKSAEYLNQVGDCLHQALMETWGIPENDRFHIFHEMAPGSMKIDPTVFLLNRTEDQIVFHVFTTPRTSGMKREFYARLPELLAEKVNLKPDNVFISCVNNSCDDWSFGAGHAQLLDPKRFPFGPPSRGFATVAGAHALRPFARAKFQTSGQMQLRSFAVRASGVLRRML
mmetsp:Transcript_98676/g.175692  ORF Transcript_98676/g.175692 Transcript_98676/m.175692 type:complete len:180 (+) Transcript_98676:44-583(+)